MRKAHDDPNLTQAQAQAATSIHLGFPLLRYRRYELSTLMSRSLLIASTTLIETITGLLVTPASFAD